MIKSKAFFKRTRRGKVKNQSTTCTNLLLGGRAERTNGMEDEWRHPRKPPPQTNASCRPFVR